MEELKTPHSPIVAPYSEDRISRGGRSVRSRAGLPEEAIADCPAILPSARGLAELEKCNTGN